MIKRGLSLFLFIKQILGQLGRIPTAQVSGDINIEISQRDLIEAGILPEEFNWMKKTRISTADVARVAQQENITVTDLAPIQKNGFKKWLDNVTGTFKDFIFQKETKF